MPSSAVSTPWRLCIWHPISPVHLVNQMNGEKIRLLSETAFRRCIVGSHDDNQRTQNSTSNQRVTLLQPSHSGHPCPSTLDRTKVTETSDGLHARVPLCRVDPIHFMCLGVGIAARRKTLALFHVRKVALLTGWWCSARFVTPR